MSSQFLFIISSSINHFKEDELSRFTTNDRFKQTTETIQSIKSRAPESKICLFELSEHKINSDYEQKLKSMVDIYLYLGDDSVIQNLYDNFHNNKLELFQYGKSLFEMRGLSLCLSYLITNNFLEQIRRVFKITGRYLLNNNFELQDYKSKLLINKYVCNFRHFNKKETEDNVHYHVYKNEGIMNTALWSLDTNLVDETIECLEKSFDYLLRMLLYTPGNDIEHSLYEYIDKSKLIYCDTLGVTLRKGMDEHDCKI